MQVIKNIREVDGRTERSSRKRILVNVANLQLRTGCEEAPSNVVAHVLQFLRRSFPFLRQAYCLLSCRFAQFIDSQNGLDEIMGITLSQRNRSLPVESAKHMTLSEAPSTGTTGSPAAASGSPVEVVFATQDSQVDNVPPTERSPVGLEKYPAADISQEPLSAKRLTAEFKVPKPVFIGTNSGLTNGGAMHSGIPSKFKLLLEKQNPTLGGLEGVTKTKVESDVSSRQEKKGADMEKVVPVLTGDSDKDVPLAIISKYRNVEPCTLPKERNKGDDNAGTADRQGHTNPMKKVGVVAIREWS